jgi:AcrR family transcriptional regulator
MTNSESKRRKERAPLTRERILRAAIEFADREGIAALTMRKLADGLGVEAMSLYHHLPNKEAILDGMVDIAFSEITVPEDAPWKEAMRLRAHSAREVLLRHRWAIGLLETRTNPGHETLRHHDAVLGVLHRAGFSIELTAHAVSLIDAYVYGFVMQEANLPFTNAEDLGPIAEAIMANLPVEEFPYFSLMMEYALAPGYTYAAEFAWGLELMLDGLEAAGPQA